MRIVHFLALLAGTASAGPLPPERPRPERTVSSPGAPGEPRVAGGSPTLQGRSGERDSEERVEVPPLELLRAELAAKEAELAAKEAELAALRARLESPEPSDFVLSGLVGFRGVRTFSALCDKPSAGAHGLEAISMDGYLSGGWMVLTLKVRKLSGQRPGVPASARLLRADGTPVRVRRVRMRTPWRSQEPERLVGVETEPFAPGDELFRLELLDAGGERLLLLDALRFKEVDS
jgi:hypothetical protein